MGVYGKSCSNLYESNNGVKSDWKSHETQDWPPCVSCKKIFSNYSEWNVFKYTRSISVLEINLDINMYE